MGELRSNFAQLKVHDEQLLRVGLLAERYFPDDPNTSLLKLRQFAELLARHIAANVGVPLEDKQFELIQRLEDHGILNRELARLFTDVRRAGNDANHAFTGDHSTVLSILKICWQLGIWFHRTFKDSQYKSGPFVPPRPPKDETAELRAELERLQQELEANKSEFGAAQQQLGDMQDRLKQALDEQTVWAELAEEVEASKAAIEEQLKALQAKSAQQTPAQINSLIVASANASSNIHLDEAATRKLIDQQLRNAGWEADSEELRYCKGARPQKNRNLAIAEWPTSTGPADYVLFIGLQPVAAIEAKRKNKNVAADIQQAKRYSRSFNAASDHAHNGGPWGDFRLPFVFSTNGRPYLKQLAEFSGIWFCDVRRSTNQGRPLDGWYTPDGMVELLRRDEEASHRQLEAQAFNYGFPIRDYQRAAIEHIQRAIAEGQRNILVAMATGTGKTKTCIALIYRLLKAQRFRRILFLVDRSALGEQAANAFKDTRMESLQTFADTFGILEIDEKASEGHTRVQIATIQGMVRRVVMTPEDAIKPPVDEYDCIVVDECHRGYLLDKEMSDEELSFRDQNDYISKYRRVIEYFDAIKIGLTATPALHTTEIFGAPCYSYSYRDAVIDGYLIDHEPPYQIETELSRTGIQWAKGEQVKRFDPNTQQIDLFQTPDEITIEVEGFNRKVITEPFNRTVCEYLARELDPYGRQKTLIFCATDTHADMVVRLLKDAFIGVYGEVDDDAVMKITGAADKPLLKIRQYKNEQLPNVAVTVDLLSTGIDVPEICNIVFLRRVNSRILFDQMMGRATRLCDEIGKTTFRIFDAVRIYEALQQMTAMQPVVQNPKITFEQLAGELATLKDPKEHALAKDQFLAKIQRKRRHLSETQEQDFEYVAGMTVSQFIDSLQSLKQEQIASWFLQHPAVGKVLDRKDETLSTPLFVSEHPDEYRGVKRGYGKATRPQDYLDEFAEYIRTHKDSIPALVTVLTRPQTLKRSDLRELAMELDRAGFSESSLSVAWREMTNKDIAARIVGFIRAAANSDPLIPYEQRVDHALDQMLASRKWTTPQRQWLQKIAAQSKANIVVDREAIDHPDQIFRREGGGFARLDKLFEGQLAQVLDTFNEAIWQQPAA